jgi:hypothetical protein
MRSAVAARRMETEIPVRLKLTGLMVAPPSLCYQGIVQIKPFLLKCARVRRKSRTFFLEASIWRAEPLQIRSFLRGREGLIGRARRRTGGFSKKYPVGKNPGLSGPFVGRGIGDNKADGRRIGRVSLPAKKAQEGV